MWQRTQRPAFREGAAGRPAGSRGRALSASSIAPRVGQSQILTTRRDRPQPGRRPTRPLQTQLGPSTEPSAAAAGGAKGQRGGMEQARAQRPWGSGATSAETCVQPARCSRQARHSHLQGGTSCSASRRLGTAVPGRHAGRSGKALHFSSTTSHADEPAVTELGVDRIPDLQCGCFPPQDSGYLLRGGRGGSHQRCTLCKSAARGHACCGSLFRSRGRAGAARR